MALLAGSLSCYSKSGNETRIRPHDNSKIPKVMTKHLLTFRPNILTCASGSNPFFRMVRTPPIIKRVPDTNNK